MFKPGGLPEFLYTNTVMYKPLSSRYTAFTLHLATLLDAPLFVSPSARSIFPAAG